MHHPHILENIFFHLTLFQIVELPPQLTGSWEQLQEEEKNWAQLYMGFFKSIYP